MTSIVKMIKPNFYFLVRILRNKSKRRTKRRKAKREIRYITENPKSKKSTMMTMMKMVMIWKFIRICWRNRRKINFIAIKMFIPREGNQKNVWASAGIMWMKIYQKLRQMMELILAQTDPLKVHRMNMMELCFGKNIIRNIEYEQSRRFKRSI